MPREFKIVVEKHADGYVAYPTAPRRLTTRRSRDQPCRTILTQAGIGRRVSRRLQAGVIVTRIAAGASLFGVCMPLRCLGTRLRREWRRPAARANEAPSSCYTSEPWSRKRAPRIDAQPDPLGTRSVHRPRLNSKRGLPDKYSNKSQDARGYRLTSISSARTCARS
jgi:hypothetical protein